MTLSFSCDTLEGEVSGEVVKSGGRQTCREKVALHHASPTVQPEEYNSGMYPKKKSPEGMLQLHLSDQWNSWPGQMFSLSNPEGIVSTEEFL